MTTFKTASEDTLLKIQQTKVIFYVFLGGGGNWWFNWWFWAL